MDFDKMTDQKLLQDDESFDEDFEAFVKDVISQRISNTKAKNELEDFMLAPINTVDESGRSDLISWFARVQRWCHIYDSKASYIMDHISYVLKYVGDRSFDFLVCHYGVVYSMLVPIYGEILDFEDLVNSVCGEPLNDEQSGDDDWQMDEPEFIPSYEYCEQFFDDEYEFDM